MDFNQFDSRKAADRGSPMQIMHPVTRDPMRNEDGSPCIVHVLGAEGTRSQEVQREAGRLPKLGDDATLEDWHDRLCFTASRLIVGFDGVYNGAMLATATDADWFLNLNMANPADRGSGPSYVEQVLRHHNSRAAYLGKLSAVSSEPQSNSDGSTPSPKAAKRRASKS